MKSGMRDLVTPDHLAQPVSLLPFRAQMLAPSRIGDPHSARAFARPYTEVARRLAVWEARGYVHTADKPALVLHDYTVDGLTARGLVGLLDLRHRASPGETAGVYPHEDVHLDQVQDLADRMGEMEMNPAPILLTHHGTPQVRQLLDRIADTVPDRSFLDRQGNRHTLWHITDPTCIEHLQAGLRDAHLMIADGHHRYSAYLDLAEKYPGTGFDTGLAMIVDQADTPLFLGAIHRVVPSSIDMLERVAGTMGARVHRVLDREAALDGLDERTFVLSDGTRWATVEMPEADTSAPVQWLHSRWLPAAGVQERLDYHHSVDAALGSLAELPDHDHSAILLPAPDLRLIERVASAGQVLPEKATSFQPKPSLGVLMRQV